MRTVFGLDEGPALDRLRECLLRLLRLADSPAAAFLAIPPLRIEAGGWTPWGRFQRDRAAFRGIILEEIARRRAEPARARTDILSLLLEASDERGAPMADDELVDEMFTLLMAGHETTATALAWFFARVLPRPDVRARLDAERPSAGDGVEPARAVRLEYLDAAIKETMRINPPFPTIIRLLKAPQRIGNRELPAGVAVSPQIYLAHRRPESWPEPERFEPERFLGVRPNPWTYLPFGGGERRCLGAAFATYEMKVVLARVLSRTTLALAPGYEPRPVLRTVAVAPSRGVPVVMEARPR
jgi:cytochrome P450